MVQPAGGPPPGQNGSFLRGKPGKDIAFMGSDKAIKIRASRINISFAWIEFSKLVIVLTAIADLLSVTA